MCCGVKAKYVGVWMRVFPPVFISVSVQIWLWVWCFNYSVSVTFWALWDGDVLLKNIKKKSVSQCVITNSLISALFSLFTELPLFLFLSLSLCRQLSDRRWCERGDTPAPRASPRSPYPDPISPVSLPHCHQRTAGQRPLPPETCHTRPGYHTGAG